MKDLFSVTQPNIGENRPNLTSYYETVNTTAASKVDHMGNMGQDGGYGTLRSDQGQQYPTVISRQESHVINQVTNNNTPALVAQALSGMPIRWQLSRANLNILPANMIQNPKLSPALTKLSNLCTFSKL